VIFDFVLISDKTPNYLRERANFKLLIADKARSRESGGVGLGFPLAVGSQGDWHY